MEEIKKVIVEYASKGKKTKFYFKDMQKGVNKTIPDAKA
ncbi:MAG: sulfite reductase, partial [Syntrophobacter sp. DG_60]